MALGVELGYAEITTDFTGTSTSLADVTGLSVTIDVGARPIMVRFYCGAAKDTAGTFGAAVALDEDGTDLGNICGLITATDERPTIGERRRAPAAGSHTYKIRYKQVTAGTLTIRANTGASGTISPAFVQVVEI